MDFIPVGDVRRVVIKDDHGNTFKETPVITGPLLASGCAVVTLISQFTLVVPADREDESADVQKTEPESSRVSRSRDAPPEDEATTEAEWENEGGASK